MLLSLKMEEGVESQGTQESLWELAKVGNRCFLRDPRKNTKGLSHCGLQASGMVDDKFVLY